MVSQRGFPGATRKKATASVGLGALPQYSIRLCSLMRSGKITVALAREAVGRKTSGEYDDLNHERRTLLRNESRENKRTFTPSESVKTETPARCISRSTSPLPRYVLENLCHSYFSFRSCVDDVDRLSENSQFSRGRR